MSYPHFKFYNRQDILSITRLRHFETKLGECIQHLQDKPLAEALSQSKAQYVIVGIPEDIGVQANYGVGGTETIWLPFLQALCNMQSTDAFTGEEVILSGYFDFSDIKSIITANAKSQDELIDACRHAVANIIDNEVEDLVKVIISAGKIPVVIGGGHNNAYPLIKGAAKSLQKAGKLSGTAINVINADAHSGYRIAEGRHSGNSFRYAMEEGFLKKYAVIGLQENYNSQRVIDDLYSNIHIQYSSFEDISLREKLNFRQAIVQAISFTEESFTGIELDMDCIEQMCTSASNAFGFTALQARQYINFTAYYPNIAYLHICEGAAQLINGQSNTFAAKLVSELVSDFIKVNRKGWQA
ncbi:MAG: arginase family protein [Chitinophagaceae bacterium]|nr:arginase family protein [Chitinophagaceae bacterium]